ncbi:hypothetical protein ACIA8F_12015 [Streptomyces sp. NPDC051563]|uniref:hypothetical protein n=1 Tax=Streptomyces sp. NPDC051563 TaxID=3365659 RepID=UPI0037B22DE3
MTGNLSRPTTAPHDRAPRTAPGPVLILHGPGACHRSRRLDVRQILPTEGTTR